MKRLIFLSLIFLFACGSGVAAESRFAKFGTVKVHYQTSGTGKTAVVFVHGWTCNLDFWRGQTSAFPKYKVIALDLPGHGLSDKPETNYTMDYFAGAIEAVMRDAKADKAVLVGHSMGTPVIRQFYRLYPKKTAALVIVDGALRPMATKEQIEQYQKLLKTNYKQFSAQMIEGMLLPVKDEKIKIEIRQAMLAAPEHVALSAMAGMTDEKNFTGDKINVPVLAVLAKSPAWKPDTETFLRSLAPALEFQMWENTSHFLMMDKPEEFNRTLETFLVKNKLAEK